MNADAVVNVSNSTSDESGSRKRCKLNQNPSFKTEVLDILEKITEFASGQFNVDNEIIRFLPYETDGTVTESGEQTSFENGRQTVEALMTSSRQEIFAQGRHILETKLSTFVNNWSSDSKLVYGLKHQYSESNLLFGNLKTADKAVASFLLEIAKSSDLKVFLGIFIKTSSTQYDSFNRSGYDHESADFEPEDGECVTSNSYTLKNLVSTDGNRLLASSLINVDMDKEVIPENCFNDIEPYRETAEPTGYTGLKVCKYYRCAAIAMWPMRYFLQILKKYGASSVDIDMIFMNETELSENNEITQRILLTWAQEIISNNHTKSVRMIKAIIGMENLAVIQMLFSRCVILNESSILILESTCEKYGWKTFSLEISTMFKKLSIPIAVKLLTQLVIGTEKLHTEKQQIFRDVLKITLDKYNDELQPHSAWYARPANLNDKTKKRKEEQDILLSICQLAERISFDMLNFAKTKSLVVFVPVLLRLVPNELTTSNIHWLDVCQYFLHIMEAEAIKPLTVLNWKRDDTTFCSCIDCLKLTAFLQSDVESIRLKMGKIRRRHLHEEMNRMQNIVHETDREGLSAILVITKTTKTGFDDEEKRKISKTFLENLRVITPL